MNYGLILAGGVGQRMRSSGMPKQFINVFGKPIIIYTIEKFEICESIDSIIVVCNSAWIEHLQDLIKHYGFKKVETVISGGRDRQESIWNGLHWLISNGAYDDDIVIIHDGVRPLIETPVISENIRIAKLYGNAMTVTPVTETVIITDDVEANFNDFKKRNSTYSITSPQSFQLRSIVNAYEKNNNNNSDIPLLDSAMILAFQGNRIHLVKENNHNIKITTPEDYYMLKGMIELEENKFIFGI